MPRVSKAKVEVDTDTSTIRFNFTNNQAISLALSDIPPDSLKHFTMRGIVEKVRDSYAGMKDADGAYTVAIRMVQAILEGKASVRIAGKHGPRITLLAQAFSAVTGHSLEECQEKLSGFSKEQLEDLRSRAKIQQAMLKIRQTTAAAKIKALAKEAKEEGEISF